MNNTRKLSLVLCILVATLVLTMLTLGIVLVSGTQYVVTDLDIHYSGGKKIKFKIGSDCINSEQFQDITIPDEGYTIDNVAVPAVPGKCFDGWYKDSNLADRVEFPLTVDTSVTLYPSYYDATSDLILVYNTETKTYWVSTYNGNTSTIVIPDVYNDGTNGYNNVTGINSSAFQSCTNITNVKFSNNITIIESFAFQDCTEIASLIIPDGVSQIGGYAFDGCSKLASINFPKNLKKIEFTTFARCAFVNIDIPEGVEIIEQEAFGGCMSLQSITIPSSVTRIDVHPFSSGGVLTSIVVSPNNTVYKSENNCIIEISTNTLIIGCSTTIIPDGVVTIGNNAFDSCTNLSSISLPDGVTTIRESAFINCSNLVTISIPDSVVDVGECAFSNCGSLQYYMRSNINYLGNRSNPYVVLANVDSSVKTGITSCDIIQDGCNVILDRAFMGCSKLTSINLPETIVTVGESAFANCVKLEYINFPTSVKTVGRNALSGCTSLTNVETMRVDNYWMVTNSKYSSTGTLVTFTYKTSLITLFTDTYCSMYWIRVD